VCNIFLFLDFKDLCNLSQVCKRFLHITNNNTLWKSLCIKFNLQHLIGSSISINHNEEVETTVVSTFKFLFKNNFKIQQSQPSTQPQLQLQQSFVSVTDESSNMVVVKCSLQRLFKGNKSLIKKIQGAVEKMNQIVTETYHLLNLHIRRLLEEDLPIPDDIDQTWLRNFVFLVSTLKKKETGSDDVEINQTYKELYKPLLVELKKPDRTNLSDAINYALQEMLTGIKNKRKIKSKNQIFGN